MQDYYKILGVKSTASPEEIHARWIELMRKFHPDRATEGEVEDESVREINEAYGVLKDSSSRGQYDLSRAYQRKKRNLYLQRMVTPPAILVILFILGFIYLQRPRVATLTESVTLPARHLTDMKANPPSSPPPNEPSILNQTNQTNETNEINQINQTNPRNQTNETTPKPVLKAKKSPRRQNPVPSPKLPNKIIVSSETNQTNQINKIDQRDEINETNQLNQLNQSNKLNQSKVLASPPVPTEPNSVRVPNQTSRKNKTNETNQTNKRNETNQINQTNEIDEIDERNETNQTDQINQTNQTVAQLKEPPAIVTEEEVRQFLEHYKKKYVRQDIDDFLSLFSPKAVQNGRDGFNEIREIYSDFFHQSHELRYHLEDTRIKIYQEVLISGLFYEHAAVVEARYQVDQTLVKKGEKKVWKGDIRLILVRENGALKILYLDFKHEKSR